ncbi:MAG: hypothetical protein H6612_11665 [Ignavibacteriales bacterium]|nr:hypothetical protein [Ignavibacteriales bacterium]
MKKIILFILFLSINALSQNKINLRSEYLVTLSDLANALLALQINETNNSNFGALQCPSCNILHTRAAEAVFPFTIMYEETKDKKYLTAAINLGNWLIDQQLEEGQWKETPWEWTGTTADQLLMITLAYPLIENELSDSEKIKWKNSIKSAADYLEKYMSPDFASINYNPTTAACMMTTYSLIPDEKYRVKAKQLADWTIAKMDEAGFIQGEAARSFGVKYGVDLGYEMDMSLWGLELYSKLNNDKNVHEIVKRSLEKNLNFVYPNGAIDGSWGSRCYKWTTFGSKTADGSQILFSLFADEDERYATASIRNLNYLRSMIKDGLIGNGPHFWDIMADKLCNYPTFARAKNLALSIFYTENKDYNLPELPSDISGWYKYYPTINTLITRSENFMMTVTGYNYKDLTFTNGGQYNQHPTGGTVANIWLKDFGFLQTSSQTKYIRGEVMHMPVMNDTVIALTPRIEFSNENGYFTNLYEFENRIQIEEIENSLVKVKAVGELKNEHWYQGGVGYSLEHIVNDNYIQKNVEINFHDRNPIVKIIEPIVQDKVTEIKMISPKKAEIIKDIKKFYFEIIEGDVMLSIADQADKFIFPFPAMKVFPLQIIVIKPESGFIQKIKYRLSID